MAKYKVSESALGILWEGLKLYCTYFTKYSLYMAFPVLGQIAGLMWIFTLTYFFTGNADYLIQRIPALNSFSAFFLCLMLMVLPGLIYYYCGNSVLLDFRIDFFCIFYINISGIYF